MLRPWQCTCIGVGTEAGEDADVRLLVRSARHAQSLFGSEPIFNLVDGGDCEDVEESQRTVAGVADSVLPVAGYVGRRPGGDCKLLTIDGESTLALEHVVDLVGLVAVVPEPPTWGQVGHTSGELWCGRLCTENSPEGEFTTVCIRPDLAFDVGLLVHQC